MIAIIPSNSLVTPGLKVALSVLNKIASAN